MGLERAKMGEANLATGLQSVREGQVSMKAAWGKVCPCNSWEECGMGRL